MLDIPYFAQECNKTLLSVTTVKQADQGREYFEYEDWFKPLITILDDLIKTNPYFLKPFEVFVGTECFFKTLIEKINTYIEPFNF